MTSAAPCHKLPASCRLSERQVLSGVVPVGLAASMSSRTRAVCEKIQPTWASEASRRAYVDINCPNGYARLAQSTGIVFFTVNPTDRDSALSLSIITQGVWKHEHNSLDLDDLAMHAAMQRVRFTDPTPSDDRLQARQSCRRLRKHAAGSACFRREL